MKKQTTLQSILTNVMLVLTLTFFGYACEMGSDIDEGQYEPNDSEEKATEIGVYDSIQGYLGENDVDFFEFDTKRNYIDFTRINIDNRDRYNEIEARIFNEYMDQIAKLIGTQGDDMRIKFANTGGKYFIKIKSYNDKEGEYSMSVDELDANDDYEPDNDINQGQEIDYYPSNEIVGTILTDEDFEKVDYECYKVLVKSGQQVDFDILPSSSQVQLHLVMYNSDKDPIQVVDKGQGEAITTWYFYNTGDADVYMYLELSGSVPDNGGDYRISFTETTYTGKKKGEGIAPVK